MHHIQKIIILAAVGLVVGLSAQTTITDNFSGSTNWSTAHSSGGGSLSISGGRANYTVASPTDYDWSILTWSAGTYAYTSNWETQVDVHANAAGSLTTGAQYFYGSLTVFRTGDTLNPNASTPTFNLLSADIVRPGDGTNHFQTGYALSGDDFYESGITTNNSTDAALRVAFNATTKVLTTYFDANGATGGYNWTTLSSIDVDGAQNWNMTGSSTFSLALAAYSGDDAIGPTIGAGGVYFDNFSVSAVPEPSTYAAIFGGLALIGAVWARKRRTQPNFAQDGKPAL
jgi:PEP-CTERM motif